MKTGSEKRNDLGLPKDLVGIPNAFKILLSHARQFKFGGPHYDGLQKAFMGDVKHYGYSVNTPFDWSETGESQGARYPALRWPKAFVRFCASYHETNPLFTSSDGEY